MKILHLKIRSFKPFSNLMLPEGDSNLPEGLILIRGPNSTGKSSLFEAILWGLWGADAVDLTNDELINFRSTSCQVVLTFQVAGAQYKIDRSYDPANGLAVVLFLKREGAWKRIADKSKSVSSKLDEILSLELRQALNTLLVRQGEVAVIANATPSVLRDLLVKVYDINLLNQMSSHLESLEKDVELRINALETDYIRPDQIESEIKECNNRIERFKTSLDEKKKEVKSGEKLLQGIPDTASLRTIHELLTRIDQLHREVELKQEALKEDLLQAGVVDASASILNARLDALEKGRKRIDRERIDLKNKVQSIDREVGLIVGTRRDLEDKIHTLKEAGTDEIIQCPTCSKPLSLEDRTRLISEYETTVKEGTVKRKELEGTQRKLNSTIIDLEDQLSRMSKSEDAAKRVSQGQNRVDQSREEAAAVQEELANVLRQNGIKDIKILLKKYNVENVLNLETKVGNLETNLKVLKESILEGEENIQREQEKIAERKGKKAEMERVRDEVTELETMKAHAIYVRRRLVNGFVADYVFQKRLLGIIKGATNPYVRAFTNGQYTAIDLEPTPAKGRSGAGLVLRIWDERDQAWKKTSQLSYGDRTAISLALRLGISRTMSSIRPLKDSPVVTPRVRSVLLDEPLGGLDRARREAVVRNLINDQSFEQILLITHTDVQGWEGVPVIDVSKTGTSSNAVLEM